METLDTNGNSVSTVGEYFYNGDGLRIKKVVPSTGETTIFAYDASNRLVAEYSTIIEPPATAKTSYLTTDHLGSPRIITDALGDVTSRRDFMPFGEEILRAVYGSDSVRQKFTGYERDDETGLDFAEARYYYNNHGRFTAVDPLLASGKSADPQTFNRYAYTMNRPLILTDPTGLDPFCQADGRGCGNLPQNYRDEPSTITVDLNIVYNSDQFTREQVEAAMKPQLKDLANTFGRIAIEFNVTYTSGSVNASRTEITSGAVQGALNVFYFDDSTRIRSYSRTETGNRHIFISQKRGHAAIRAGTLSHEVGHAFGLIGGLTTSAVNFLGPRGNNIVTNTIDNLVSDAQIEAANLWLRNGLVVYGRNWVNDYRTATETIESASRQRQGIGPIRVVPRTPSVWDLYRDGARQIAAQRRR